MTRPDLQQYAVTVYRAWLRAEDDMKPTLQASLRAILTQEAELAERAVSLVLQRKLLPTKLINIGGWSYDRELEIVCTKACEPPGQHFAFGFETVMVPVSGQLVKLRTGRCWLDTDGDLQSFRHLATASHEAYCFLDRHAQAFGDNLVQEFKRRLAA